MWPLVCIVCSCGLAAILTSSVGHSPFLQFAFIGSFAIFLSVKPSRIALAVTALLGVALYTVQGEFGKLQWMPSQSIIALLAFFGAGSLIVGGAIWASHVNREYVAMLALPVLVLLTFAGFVLLPSDRIPSIDRYLYVADQYLGEPGFAVGRIFAAKPWLSSLCGLVYAGLPAAAAVIWARLPEPSRVRFASSTIVAGLIGFALYRVFPAAGPRYAFASFPFLPQWTSSQLHRVILPGVRLNAMPSLHIVWTLLILRYAWPLSTVSRCGSMLFLVLTILATLGSGEHYAVDLIAAIPCAIFIGWLIASASKSEARRHLDDAYLSKP